MMRVTKKNKKKELRKEIKKRKKSYSKDCLYSMSEKIMNRLEKKESFIQADNVLLYYSLGDEVNTIDFIKKWSKHKKIILPVVVGEDLILKEYDESKMKKGYKSIMEPSGVGTVSSQEIQLSIIPGMAFDSDCSRLGRGKGFYDRLLSELNCEKIGVCFDFQILQDIPCEEFDKKMDSVLSETYFFS